MRKVVDSLQDRCSNKPISSEMNLKKQLKLYIDLRGLSASELARKAGVSKQVISLWLGGVKPKNIDQVKKVSDALKVSVDTLLFGDGLPNESSANLEALLGDEWLSGQFEIKIRRIKKQDR